MAKPNPVIHIGGKVLHNLTDEDLRRAVYHAGFPEINHLQVVSDVGGKTSVAMETIKIGTARRPQLISLLTSRSDYRE